MATLAAPARCHPDGAAHTDPDWRLAYLITGDRAAAHSVVTEVRRRTAEDPAITPGRRRALVVALARQHLQRHAPPGDHLWHALRGLPRRQRAEILTRLR